jgi:hypothetical protein
MADAAKCDKCMVYFDQRPTATISLPDGLVFRFCILKVMTKGELEENPAATFFTLLHPQAAYKPQDLCPKCQREIVTVALTALTIQTQIEDIGGDR